jgi:hypothetical protein
MLLSEFNILAMASSRHVNIVNSLEDNLDLTIHCKSKDDDLGVHLLHHGDSFGWKFHNAFFVRHYSFVPSNGIMSFITLIST